MPSLMDSDPKKWVIDGHTLAKHQILGHYLGAWFPILSSRHRRVLYIDGFAGRGRYHDGSEGSPQRAMRTLIEHPILQKRQDCEFLFMFIEKNSENAAALEAELQALEDSGVVPENVKRGVVNSSFDDQMQALCEQMEAQGKNRAPTFAFIDPFGYTRFPMALLAQIAKSPNTELFINFMVGFVQRFLEREGQEDAIEKLFGMPVEQVLAGMPSKEKRVEQLVEVYMQALREKTGLQLLQRFYMINKTGNVSYALVHATNHPLGVKRMKAAMWTADPSGTYRFSDRMGDADVLFVPDPDLTPLREALKVQFAGKSGLDGQTVRDWTELYTPFREKHATQVLREFEDANIISVHRSKNARQFGRGVTFDFL